MKLSTQWQKATVTCVGFLFEGIFEKNKKIKLKNMELNLVWPYSENSSHCKDSFKSDIFIHQQEIGASSIRRQGS